MAFLRRMLCVIDSQGDSGLVFVMPGMKPLPAVKYPHMMPEDTVIWTRFLKNADVRIDEVWYDVRVGKAVEVPSGQPEWMKRFAEYSTRKRIDIVARRGNDYWIIEAKPKAGVVALGQALYYAEAFKAEFKPTASVVPAVVTDRVDPDVRPIFDRYGVVVFEVGVGAQE